MHSLLPASTTASRHSTQSKNTSRTSVHNGSKDRDTEDTDESRVHTTTSPPTNPKAKRIRPLSQTRSYHSIFSSVRGSVRNSGSSSRTTISSAKEEDEEETPTEIPKEDKATANEAVEDTQPESTNRIPSKTEKEEQEKVLTEAKESSHLSSLPKSHSPSSKSKVGNHHAQPLTPRTSSVDRTRWPPYSTSGSRSRNQKGATSSLPNSQDPVVSKNVHTSLNSEDKVSTTVAKSSTPPPQETKMEAERESPSLPLSSTEIKRISTTSHSSNIRPGFVYSNGRRVPQTKGHRYQTRHQKAPLTSSSTVSRTDDQETHSVSIVDTKYDNNNDQKISIKNNEDPPSPYQYTTTLLPSIKKESTQDFGNNDYKDKAVDSNSPSLEIPSTASPAHRSSISNRNSRIVVGNRKDQRILWSRAASSVGAGKPILKGLNPTGSEKHASDKTKSSPTTYTTKHVVDSNLAKPTVNSRPASSNNGQRTSNEHIHKEDTSSNNDHKLDYLSEISKETHDISHKNSVPTSSPKTITSDVKEIQRSGQPSQNSSHSSFTTLSRLGLGSNGKVRSALLASRLNEIRLRGGLQTVQNAKMGSAAKQNSSSSSISTSSSSSASQTMEHKASSAGQNTNVRSAVGSVSRSSLKLPSNRNSGGDTSTDFKAPVTVPARNPVLGSRHTSRSDKHARGKTPISLHRPSYGQGKLNFIHTSCAIYTVCT